MKKKKIEKVEWICFEHIILKKEDIKNIYLMSDNDIVVDTVNGQFRIYRKAINESHINDMFAVCYKGMTTKGSVDISGELHELKNKYEKNQLSAKNGLSMVR